MGSFFAALWTATAMSVYKPWGRTPWGSGVRHVNHATRGAVMES
jgi:hypothetical protein